MAVIFYAEGEHPSGFVGYRVATPLGTQQEFRQRYFPLNEYSAATAERLANELDAQWREQAVDEVRLNRLRRSKGSAGISRAGQTAQGSAGGGLRRVCAGRHGACGIALPGQAAAVALRVARGQPDGQPRNHQSDG